APIPQDARHPDLRRLCRELLQVKHFLLERRPRSHPMRPLRLQDDLVVNRVGASFAAALVNAAHAPSGRQVPPHQVEHDGLLQDWIARINVMWHVSVTPSLSLDLAGASPTRTTPVQAAPRIAP